MREKCEVELDECYESERESERHARVEPQVPI